LNREHVKPIPVSTEPPRGFWEREIVHFPSPLSPMTRSLFFEAANKYLLQAFEELGFIAQSVEMRDIGGWQYFRVVPPMGKEEEPSFRFLSWVLIRIHPYFRRRLKAAKEVIHRNKAGKILENWNNDWRPEMELKIASLKGADLASLSDADLQSHFESCYKLWFRGARHHVFVNFAHLIAIARFVLLCQEQLNWSVEKSLGLLSGLSGKSTEPSHRMAELADRVQGKPAIHQYLLNPGPHPMGELKALDVDFAEAFRNYQKNYGCRALRYEVMEPTLGEKPQVLLQLIRNQIQRSYDPVAEEILLSKQREESQKNALDLISQKGPRDQEKFKVALKAAQDAYPAQEDNEFFNISIPLALLRYVLLEMGSRLKNRGLIKEITDIFFLNPEEARQAFVEGRDYTEVIFRRRGERVWIKSHPGPSSYGTPPKGESDWSLFPEELRQVSQALVWGLETDREIPKGKRDDAINQEILGKPGSPGEYTGAVRVVLNEYEFNKVQAGDVLVCPITCPVWSILFSSIGALVTDTGGVLAHAAIIAREYGIPAVLATGNATQRLRDGQIVKVDGSTGRVSVVSSN